MTKSNNYRLELINRDSELDLVGFKNRLEDVAEYILNGGADKQSFKDVTSIEILNVTRTKVELKVVETATYWHSKFGQTLANKHDMRNYCNKDNSEQMFEWTLI